MFAPISAIFSLVFFAAALPNGIRLVELPAEPGSAEIVAGYTVTGLKGFALSEAARLLLFDAYAAGANIEFINEVGRTAFRIRAPKWSLPVLANRIPALFAEKGAEGAVPLSPLDFRAKVEEEIRNALLGPARVESLYNTHDAFVLISAPAPDSLREALTAIPRRGTAAGPEDTLARLAAERTLRFRSSDLSEGAVVFASPIPGVYYKQWYMVLLLDRLIHRIVPLRLQTSLTLTTRPHYYRIELTVPAGQFPEPAEDTLVQELQRLQFVSASAKDLSAARQDVLAYLESKAVHEWFASHDLMASREEGVQWVESMTPDDVRVTVRDLLIMNRVTASWAPKPRQASVSAEPLSPPAPATASAAAAVERAEPEKPDVDAPAVISPTPFPAHTDLGTQGSLPERLSSGVSIAASSENAVFISGAGITRFAGEIRAEDLKPFQQYRPDRILVLTPASAMDRARQLWSTFKGNADGETGVSRGKVSGGDLSALFVLKTMLDLKVIESGWWREASVEIDANEGSTLQIQTDEKKRAQILEWIRAIGSADLPDSYFNWAREVAVHRFDSARPGLQALMWERDTQGMVQQPETVSAKHVQDVARIYF